LRYGWQGRHELRTLRIERSVSADVLSTTKSWRARTLPLGSSTAGALDAARGRVARPSGTGAARGLGFADDLAHDQRRSASVLGRRFARLRDAAGARGVTLHRLRHNVATFLVASGHILQAQARLGHADAATTLREYAYALPLADGTIADAINDHLDLPPPPTRTPFGYPMTEIRIS
jgi:integrase